MRVGILLSLILSLLAFGTSCTLAPTKTGETRQYDVGDWERRLTAPLRLTSQTVIVDARSAFDYSMTHVMGAVNLRWEEFADTSKPTPGVLKGDLPGLARRLATYGIGPSTPVVILGYGKAGKGEEGRVAWTLLYLGLKDVQVAEVNLFKDKFTNVTDNTPRANAPEWAPQVADSLQALRKEVIAAGMGRIVEGGPRTHLIDVRSKEEYFHNSTPDLRAINIEWKEFFTADGRPDPELRSRLIATGVKPEDRIITLSNKGVRSGAAAVALLALGFPKTANYTAGFTEMLKKR